MTLVASSSFVLLLLPCLLPAHTRQVRSFPSASSSPRPLLAVQVAHGLGNRLRALASAKALADASGRRLLVVWEPSPHCNATYEDLFAPPQGFQVVRFHRPSPHALRYDYTTPEGKDVPLRTRSSRRDLFVRSAFVLRSEKGEKDEKDEKDEKKEERKKGHHHARMRDVLRNLLKPSRAVSDLVESSSTSSSSSSPAVAVHVRMHTNQTTDVPGLDLVTLPDMERAVPHRTACHWTHFVAPLRAVLAQQRDRETSSSSSSVLVAADTPGVGALLLREARVRRGRVLEAPARCYGADRRSTLCVQHALAHLLALATAQDALLLSRWSSFSELIPYMTPHTVPLRLDACATTMPPPSPSSSPSSSPPPLPSLSVLVACRNRDTAREVLGHILALLSSSSASSSSRLSAWQVLLVDWSSDVPIRAPRGVQVLRVDGESSWNLAQAYNLALSQARHELVLKLDCDTRLRCLPESVGRIFPPRGHFVTGSWTAGGERAHLNGVLLARRTDLLRVGGYDERLYHYGWDDSDLYARLQSSQNLTRLLFEDDCLTHLPHSHTQRALSSSSLSSSSSSSLPLSYPNLNAHVLPQHHRYCIGTDVWTARSTPRTEFRRNLASSFVSFVKVAAPDPIDRSSTTCQPRLAVAAVLHTLFQTHCPRCDEARFWRIAKSNWTTPRQFLSRLAPRSRHVEECLARWHKPFPRACREVAAASA